MRLYTKYTYCCREHMLGNFLLSFLFFLHILILFHCIRFTAIILFISTNTMWSLRGWSDFFSSYMFISSNKILTLAAVTALPAPAAVHSFFHCFKQSVYFFPYLQTVPVFRFHLCCTFTFDKQIPMRKIKFFFHVDVWNRFYFYFENGFS